MCLINYIAGAFSHQPEELKDSVSAKAGDLINFFFSSRRRHTRFKCDWSSDVCSSDLHSEGFKPPHKVKTGFDFAELRDVANAVSDLLGLELSGGQTLVSDIPTRQMYRPQLPLMMHGIGDLQEKKFVKKQPHPSDGEREHQNRLQRQKIIVDALQRASNQQRIYIILCCSDTLSKTTLE